MEVNKLLQQHQDYLDSMAIETMKVYIQRKPPQSFGDSLSIARISYRQAMAMLEIKLNGLEDLCKEDKIFQKQKREKSDDV